MPALPPQVDPLARMSHVPVIPAVLLALFCLFVMLFIRITHFTLFKNYEYAVTYGIHHRQHGPRQPCQSNPEMTTTSAYLDFNTVAPPRSGSYIPNMLSDNDLHDRGTSVPLLVAQGHECDGEPVELDAVVTVQQVEHEWKDTLSMHGTNNLNTPWSWTA